MAVTPGRTCSSQVYMTLAAALLVAAAGVQFYIFTCVPAPALVVHARDHADASFQGVPVGD